MAKTILARPRLIALRPPLLANAAFAAVLALAAPALADEPGAATPPAAPAPPASSASPTKAEPAPAKADPAPAKTDPAPAKQEAAPAKTEPAAADAATAEKLPPSQQPIPMTRRAGFTLGLFFAGAAGTVSGYPIDVNKRKPQNLTSTNGSFGGIGTLFLGGALTDWLVFGAGLTPVHLEGGNTVVEGFTFGFHTEAFPLFWMGGVWRELGIGLDTGTGSITGELANKPSGAAGKLIAPVIDSGSAARIAVSAFYDGLRVWKLSAGPYMAFDYTWSATINQPLFVLGLRGAMYTKAPKKK